MMLVRNGKEMYVVRAGQDGTGPTSIHASSCLSSSLAVFAPFVCCRLLGGAISSVALSAGLLRSSIVTRGESGAEDLVVDKGMKRKFDDEA